MGSSAIQMTWFEVILEQSFEAAMMTNSLISIGSQCLLLFFLSDSFLRECIVFIGLLSACCRATKRHKKKTACLELTVRNKSLVSSCASSYYGWVLLKCSTCTIGIRYIRANTNCGNKKNRQTYKTKMRRGRKTRAEYIIL